MVYLTTHARDRLRERYGLKVDRGELRAICEALADNLKDAEEGDWTMDVRLPDRGLKLSCVVAMPAGAIKTILPLAATYSAKRLVREARREKVVTKFNESKRNRGHKVRRRALHEKLDAREAERGAL